MKYIKSYENTIEEDNNKPQLGDYVICYEEIDTRINDDGLTNFLSSNIGQIVKINSLKAIKYSVKYDNVPSELDTWFHDKILDCREMRESEIIHWSKNKKDLEVIINQNKFNL